MWIKCEKCGCNLVPCDCYPIQLPKEQTKTSKIINEFHEALDMLISLNWRRREALTSDTFNVLTPVAYAIEFCTVKCDIGRQSGKSSYIKKRSGYSDLIIVHRQSAKNDFEDCDADVYTIGEVLSEIFELKKYEKIFIDEPKFSLRNNGDLTKMYGTLAFKSVHQTFIFLGI